MRAIDADDILDGVALLECLGSLYEYAGVKDGKFVFQSVSDDRCIKTTYEGLLTMPEYAIQF